MRLNRIDSIILFAGSILQIEPYVTNDLRQAGRELEISMQRHSTLKQLMKLMFKVRDIIGPRLKVLEEAGIERGFSVLDFGCGPDGYITIASFRLIYPLRQPIEFDGFKRTRQFTQAE